MPQRVIRMVIVGAVVVGGVAVASVALRVGQAGGEGDMAPGKDVRTVRIEDEKRAPGGYWTEERMRNAEPEPLPADPATEVGRGDLPLPDNPKPAQPPDEG